MNRVAVVIFAFVAAPLFFWVLNRRSQTLRCDELLRRLHPHQLKDRDKHRERLSKGFLKATDGALGLWFRWRNRSVFLRLCQMRAMHHGLESEELLYVTRRAAKLTAWTALSFVLYPFRRWTSRAEYSAWRAFCLYGEIADRTHSFFSSDDVPMCSIRLGHLL